MVQLNIMWRTVVTPFLPRATLIILCRFLPRDLAQICVDAARDQPLPAWDPYGFWVRAVPEYDENGDYGFLPKVETGLPMW